MNSEANFTNFWPENLRAHSQPGTRAVHLACTLTGSPLLVAAVALRRWWWFALALAVPYALAWISFFFCGAHRPAAFEHSCGPDGRIKKWLRKCCPEKWATKCAAVPQIRS